MSGMWQDVTYALRLLRRDRWFAAVAAAMLALGFAANGAIFTVVHAVLLRPVLYEVSLDSILRVGAV